MSTRRLVATAVVMAAAAAVLRVGTPDLGWVASTGGDLQRAADTVGPEMLLLSGVAAVAWLTWLWGLLGLVLTALSALPGLAGAAAGAVSRRLLPASLRRAAALALGVGLAAGGPVLTACLSPAASPTASGLTTVSASGPAADWPTAGQDRTTGVPDWPAPPTPPPPPAQLPPAQEPPPAPTQPPPAQQTAPASGHHVVVRGDCLWDIAEADLRTRTGREPADREVVAAVTAWWRANADVIGPDPDLLLPGQVLRPPA